MGQMVILSGHCNGVFKLAIKLLVTVCFVIFSLSIYWLIISLCGSRIRLFTSSQTGRRARMGGAVGRQPEKEHPNRSTLPRLA